MWNAILDLVGGSAGWALVSADDQVGVVEAQVTSWPLRRVSYVWVDVRLDANAQTRVDVASTSAKGGGWPALHRRRIRRFLGKLDVHLEAGPEAILADAPAS